MAKLFSPVVFSSISLQAFVRQIAPRSLVALVIAFAAQIVLAGGHGSVHVDGYTRKDGTYVHAHDRAAPGTASSSTDGFGNILVIGVVLMVGLAFAVINASRKPKPLSPEKVDEQSAEAMAFLDKLNTGKFTPPNTPLVLAAEEIALLNEPSRLAEARATRVYAGGGTRVHGIYIGGGQSSSVQNLKELDSGTLTLTTKRLVFTGSMENRVANIKDIVSVEGFADAIEISTAKRAKRQVYFVRNGTLWGALVRTVVKGGVSINLTCSRCGQPVTAEQKNCPNCNKPTEVPRSFQDALRKKAESTKQLSQPEIEPSTDIRFNCPHCDQHLCVEQSGAGIAVNCPNCNEQIEVPHTTAASQ